MTALSSESHRLVIAQRLTAFSECLGEVTGDSYEDMKAAVAETTAVILKFVTGDELDFHSRKPEENLALALKALRGGRTLVSEDATKQILENVLACVDGLLEGLRACREGKRG